MQEKVRDTTSMIRCVRSVLDRLFASLKFCQVDLIWEQESCKNVKQYIFNDEHCDFRH